MFALPLKMREPPTFCPGANTFAEEGEEEEDAPTETVGEEGGRDQCQNFTYVKIQGVP